MELISRNISFEVAKISKRRPGKPRRPLPIPTHPIAPHTILLMKYYGIHWTLNAFIKKLKRAYIDLVGNIPRYARIRLLPRTAAG